jgi:hypothetical protein
MTESRSSLYSLLTGLAGGAAAWTGVEIILWQTPAFPDLRILTLSLGAAAGLLLGAIVPMAEGLRQNQRQKLPGAVITGSLTGLIFGALGMAAGQLLLGYLAVSSSVHSPAYARIPGWIILGTAVGGASGLRSRSLRRVSAGALGGFIGGVIGGISAEFLSSYAGGFSGRAAGMMFWGMAVAFFADRMESRRSRGRLTVLTGELKGRSFPVNQKKMKISHSKTADLTIPGDSGTGEDKKPDALLRLKNGTVILEPGDSTVVELNGEKAGTTELRYDDVIRVDGVTMIYEAKR